MDQEQKYELIEKYLEGSLTKAEQASFDQLNQEDPSFQQEVRLHRNLGTALKGEGVHDFRAALKDVDEQWKAPGKGTVRSLPIRRILSLAATVLVLIAAAWWFFATKNTPSAEDLFAAQFEPYTMVLNQRSETTDTPQDLLQQQAINAYNQGQFADAVSRFEELQSVATDNQTYSFYMAVSELAQGNTSKAIPMLEQLAEHFQPSHGTKSLVSGPGLFEIGGNGKGESGLRRDSIGEF
jgi:tetratricopeptide (TPR) repeat protein